MLTLLGPPVRYVDVLSYGVTVWTMISSMPEATTSSAHK
jgi:hypothetical protein